MFMYWMRSGSMAVSRKCFKIARGKAGVVLDLGRERKLSQRQRAGQPVLFGDGAFEHQRLQLRPRRVNRGGPAGRSAANDDHMLRHNRLLDSRRKTLEILFDNSYLWEEL